MDIWYNFIVHVLRSAQIKAGIGFQIVQEVKIHLEALNITKKNTLCAF